MLPRLLRTQISANFLRTVPAIKTIVPFNSRGMSDQKDDRATGLIAKQGIELLTFGTPNGHKVSILLEELKEAYGKDYTAQAVPIMDNVQKEAWYVKLNPNGRIPVIVDHDNRDFPVFEGSGMVIATPLSIVVRADRNQPFWHT